MSNMLAGVFVILMMLFPAMAQAELVNYSIVKEKSSLKFFAIMNGAPIEGRFKDFSGDISFDPEKPELSSIKAEVETAAFEVNNDDVAKNIKLPDWLSIEAFPKATLNVKKLSKFPMSMSYYGDGDVTLRGKSKPVSINFQIEHIDEESAIAKGYFTILRGDFNIGQGEWSRYDVIKNEVRVEFRMAAKKK